MKKQVKILSMTLFLILGGRGLFAQHQHELSLYGGGGLSTLNYKTTFGDQKFGLGGQYGFGYHFFFSPKWGLGTGVEPTYYNARFNMSNLGINYMAIDKDGAAFEFRSTVKSYKEKQHALLLQIPLMLQFQTNNPDSKRQFYIAAGGKAGIPLQGDYSNTASLSNAGFYEHEQSLYDTQEFMGFGNFPNKKSKGKLDFKTVYFLSAETGFKWRLKDKWSLYAGIYVDYGLNNMLEKQKVAFMPSVVAYNKANPPAFAVNSVLQSQYTQNGKAAQGFTEKITPIAAGIKLRLAFGMTGKRAKDLPEPQVAPTTNNNYAADAKRAAEEAARKAAEEAARKAAEEAALKAAAERAAAERIAADRMAQEQEAQRRAQQEANALNTAKRQIEQPIDNYAQSQTNLTGQQQQKLEEKVVLLQQYPNLQFYIFGHTCESGSKEANERAGLSRAASAKAYMLSKGITANRILGIASKRDTEPLTPNTSEENRKKNRRVQLVIQ